MDAAGKAKNAAKETKGRVKEKTGDAADNRDLQAKGKKAAGATKQAGKKVKDAFKS
jgi:uncharacterized protein YjbJ (UPF0337 family)